MNESNLLICLNQLKYWHIYIILLDEPSTPVNLYCLLKVFLLRMFQEYITHVHMEAWV